MNDTIDKYSEAHEARVGADRMALGLSCIPHEIYGDIERIKKLIQERDQAQRELQQLLESIKVTEVSIQMVDGIARPIPWAGDGEAWRMCAEKLEREIQAHMRERDEARTHTYRQADYIDGLEDERDQWRECAERLVQSAKAYARNYDLPRGIIEAEEAIAELERLKGETK